MESRLERYRKIADAMSHNAEDVIEQMLDMEDRLMIAHDLYLSAEDSNVTFGYGEKSVTVPLANRTPFVLLLLQIVEPLTPDNDNAAAF